MISWGTILYGAALSAAGAVLVVVLLLRQRRLSVVAGVVVASAVGPIGWNAILRATHASNFFTDAPIAVFPASWQDFGSGVFALAGATVVLALGPLRSASAALAARIALACALVAFLVDIYLY